MTAATRVPPLEGEPPIRPARPSARLRSLGAIVVVIALASWFAFEGVTLVRDFIGDVDRYYENDGIVLWGSDFPAFYGGAKLFLNDPGNAYEPNAQVAAILKAHDNPAEPGEGWVWLRYYNPPFYSLLLAPLTALDVRTAFVVTLGLNAAATVALAWVLGSILGWRQPYAALVILASVASLPTYYAFWHGQPTIVLAAVFGAAFLALERGPRRPPGVLLALLAAKPHWLVFSTPYMLWRRRDVVPSFVATGLVLAAPFVILGPDGVFDYVSLLFRRGEVDVSSQDFAAAVMSWHGFLSALTGHPIPWLAIVLSAVTLVPYVLIWRSGQPGLMPAAIVITTVLVIPHSHPQDWMMLAPAAAFILRESVRSRRPLLMTAVPAAWLLAIYTGLNDWAGLRDSERVIYWATPLAFGLLWTLVFWRRIESLRLPFIDTAAALPATVLTEP